MKRNFIIAAVAAALVGTALHFLYDALPNQLTALISPVNESVWEHLKLLFWPTLAAAAVLARKTEKKYALWGAFFTAILVMPLFLLGWFYLLGGGFSVSGLWLDVSLYFIAMFFGFWLAYRLFQTGETEKFAGILLMLVILYGAALILFTFAAPPLPIFLSP